MNIDDAYKGLGLEPVKINSLDDLKEEAERVNTAYRKLIKEVHPDVGGTEEAASLVNEAKMALVEYFFGLKKEFEGNKEIDENISENINGENFSFEDLKTAIENAIEKMQEGFNKENKVNEESSWDKPEFEGLGNALDEFRNKFR